jgi:hypothetical protein
MASQVKQPTPKRRRLKLPKLGPKTNKPYEAGDPRVSCTEDCRKGGRRADPARNVSSRPRFYSR